MKFKYFAVLLLAGTCYADIPEYNSPSDLNYPVMSPQGMNDSSRPFFSIIGGPAFANVSGSQTVFVDSNYSNTYNFDSSSQTLAQFELYLGLQIPIMSMMLFQVGPMIGVAGVAKPNGVIWQFSDPEFNNMRYSYNLSQGRAGLRFRLSFDEQYSDMMASPYITGSAGIAENYAYSYQNSDIISRAVAIPNFGNNTQAAFSYSLGAGLQHDISCNFRVGIGWEYTSWGKSSLGTATGQLTDNSLSLNNLYMQSILISLTYIV